jgi:hypothetical protein
VAWAEFEEKEYESAAFGELMRPGASGPSVSFSAGQVLERIVGYDAAAVPSPIEHRQARRAARYRAERTGEQVAFVNADELPAEPPAHFMSPGDGFTVTVAPPPQPEPEGFSLDKMIRRSQRPAHA